MSMPRLSRSYRLMVRRRRRFTAALAVGVLLTVTACGGSGDSTESTSTTSSSSTPTTAAEYPLNQPVPVTPENFVRAETDMEFARSVDAGGFGTFHHNRELMPIDHQTVVRPNRDTLYSTAVFDLDAGPVTVTLPDAGQRYMAMQVLDEDEYTSEVIYTSGSYTFDRDKIGTRYVMLAVRTFVDPNNPADLATVHALQDAIRVEQPGGPGFFAIPQWDPASQKVVRDALLTLASTLPDTNGAFGPKDEVDPIQHLIGAASAWGGNPRKDAIYLTVTPPENTGEVEYTLHVEHVPVNGFWSISLYNAEGYFQPNPQHAYSINNVTARTNADGSVDIRFGGCDGQAANCLPIMPGWNYMVRLYEPQPSILNGQWTFPQPQARH